jgi:hypothetical protein
MKPIILTETSDTGKNFKGEKLNEVNLKANQLVTWNDWVFLTGNRNNGKVELYKDNKFFKTVAISRVSLLEVDGF